MTTVGQVRATNIPVEFRGRHSFITWGYFQNKSGTLAKSPMDKTGSLFSYADGAKWLPIWKAEPEIDNTDLGWWWVPGRVRRSWLPGKRGPIVRARDLYAAGHLITW